VSEVAVQFSMPPPAFEIPIANVLGAVLPTNAVSVRALGVTANCGGGVMVNVTVTWAGLPVAPADVTVTRPMCVPVASPAGLSVTVIEAGAVPLLGAAVSHVVSVVADHARVPPPVLLTLSVFVFFAVSPCLALSESDAGVTDSTGCRIRDLAKNLAAS